MLVRLSKKQIKHEMIVLIFYSRSSNLSHGQRQIQESKSHQRFTSDKKTYSIGSSSHDESYWESYQLFSQRLWIEYDDHKNNYTTSKLFKTITATKVKGIGHLIITNTGAHMQRERVPPDPHRQEVLFLPLAYQLRGLY